MPKTFQPIPTGFHIEHVRGRSQLAYYFADAGFQDEGSFFAKIVFDAIIEFQFPVFGSVQVPNLLTPGFHGSTGITGPCKFILALILQSMSDSLH